MGSKAGRIFMHRIIWTGPRKRRFLLLFFLTALLLFLILVFGYVKRYFTWNKELLKTESFRAMRLSEELIQESGELSEKTGISKGRLLALAFAENGGKFPAHMQKFSSLEKLAAWAGRVRPLEYEMLNGAFQAVWDDVECFPVKCPVSFEDSWMAMRTYGGERGHEGVDLMPPVNQRDFYPVFSMTDGIVEKLGWLEKGGYRVGIRSPSGGYYYYAHLSSYADGLAEGMTLEAGELLGFMGDTGYGPEGTTGQFDVHLHLGIYINTEDGEELSVNPYCILKAETIQAE